MMDELLAFSHYSFFKVIIIREPKPFYKEKLKHLQANSINVFIKPFKFSRIISKLAFICTFSLRNFKKLTTGYSAVIGWKSLYWFLILDISLFETPLSIHAQFATQAAIISLMLKRYLKDDVEYSFTFHAYDIYFNNKWFPDLVNNSSYAFSISKYNVNYVKNKYKNINRGKIKLTRLGVFRPEVNSMEKKYNEDKLVVGFLSWFVHKKGLIYLLEAINNLKEEINIKCKLGGDGPLKDDILNFIKSHDLEDTVEYLGRIDSEQKECFFKSIDVFVLPSIKVENDMDGIPVVLMEAISYGVPLISTNTSGIPEICIDNENGLIIPEKSVDAIVTAAVYLFENKNERMKYSVNSIKVSKKYDIVDNSYKKMKLLNWV